VVLERSYFEWAANRDQHDETGFHLVEFPEITVTEEALTPERIITLFEQVRTLEK
jgi:hypothetical protein